MRIDMGEGIGELTTSPVLPHKVLTGAKRRILFFSPTQGSVKPRVGFTSGSFSPLSLSLPPRHRDFGIFSPRSAIMFFWICDVPPPITRPSENIHSYGQYAWSSADSSSRESIA